MHVLDIADELNRWIEEGRALELQNASRRSHQPARLVATLVR